MCTRVRGLVFGVCAAWLSGSVAAGTVIEMKYGASDRGTISIEGDWARTDRVSAPTSYLLAQLDTQAVYTVNSKRREIAVLPDENAADAAGLPALPMPEGTELRKVGAGPRIAGFGTEHHEVRIGERVCGDIFIARKVRSRDFDRFEQTMSAYTHQMNRQMLARAEGKGMTADVCDVAALAVEPQVRELGRVLRYSRDGKPLMEVVAIRKGAKVDKMELQLPEGYRTVDPLPPLTPHKRSVDRNSGVRDATVSAADTSGNQQNAVD